MLAQAGGLGLGADDICSLGISDALNERLRPQSLPSAEDSALLETESSTLVSNLELIRGIFPLQMWKVD